jgi:hypothetical protein
MCRTEFRQWFEDCLDSLTNRQVEWPQLLRYVLGKKLRDAASSGIFYKEKVFIDRDGDTAKYSKHTRTSEPILTRQFYKRVHQAGGLIDLGGDAVWPICWDVPNQGNEDSNRTKSRKVDLLGLRRDGSLVVFECKAENKNTPLFALLQGLDYLGCLLTSRNLKKLQDGFVRWRDKERLEQETFISKVPDDFKHVSIVATQCPHSVIVLAPLAYYREHTHYRERARDTGDLLQNWWYLSDRFWDGPIEAGEYKARLDFAVTDFVNSTCSLLPLPRGKEYDHAVTVVLNGGCASVSSLKRALGRQTKHFLQLMAKDGIIAGYDPNTMPEVLLNPQQWKQLEWIRET